jgi:copper resistance protein B
MRYSLVVSLGVSLALQANAVAQTHDHGGQEEAAAQHSQHGSAPAATPASTEQMPEHEAHGNHDAASHYNATAEAGTHDHEAMQMNMNMDMAMPVQQPGSLRDPHAYSDGFERGAGPYALANGSRISLADETNFTGLWVDRFEYVESHDTDATEFEGHAWIGDSYTRYMLRSEVEIINDSLEVAEIDLLYSRAISPFWDIRLGVRREVREEDDRNWASIGLVGLAPYWFEVDASLFLGENGNSLLDIEAEYDLLVTQRLVIQPRLDVHAYGKTDEVMRQGAGLSTVKAGFRMRYEFDRQLAPYFGVEHVVKYGRTADLLLPDENREDTHWLIGLKFWF